jgi:glutathione synthase/RimK-type ligase-like ATP-grasp enzyme
MWHWHQSLYADQLFARQLALALEARGITVYPDVRTSWHFDDKLGQKYLLESLGLPLVPTRVFYEPDLALNWLRTAQFPLVFKLRGGAGSRNVWLLKDLRSAERVVGQAFAKGFPAYTSQGLTKEMVWRFRRDGGIKSLLRIPYRYVLGIINPVPANALLLPVQKGYVYFQEFLKGNSFDHRFIVIGHRCLCVQREVRAGDFRASGSGAKNYDPELFPRSAIELAFYVADSLRTQSLAIDVMYDCDGRPLVGEVSYGFTTNGFANDCPGYFDRDCRWHPETVIAEDYIIKDFLKSVGM